SRTLTFSLTASADHPALHSFPTRRSSDLERAPAGVVQLPQIGGHRLVRRHPVERREGGEMLAGSVRWAEVRSRLARRRLQEGGRSEEHTSELQSPYDLVCRLLLEKKKKDS